MKKSDFFDLICLIGTLFGFTIALQSLKSHDPLWSVISIGTGLILLRLYSFEVNNCRAEIERRRRSVFGEEEPRGLKRQVFVVYLAVANGSHKSAAFLMVVGLGAISAGALVLLEAI